MSWFGWYCEGLLAAVVVSGLVVDYLRWRERCRRPKMVVYEVGRLHIRNQ